MGTSASIGTPTGGNWTNAKRELNRVASGNGDNLSVNSIVSNTFRGISSHRRGSGGGGGGSTGGGAISDSVIRSAAQGIGFLRDAHQSGFSTAITSLGIVNFEELDSSELISLLLNAIVESDFKLDDDIAFNALYELFQEILGEDKDEFDTRLTEYWNDSNEEDFIKSFMKKYCEDLVLHNLTDAVIERVDNNDDTDALYNMIEISVGSEVDSAVDEITEDRAFSEFDWLGSEGLELMNKIAEGITEMIEGII